MLIAIVVSSILSSLIVPLLSPFHLAKVNCIPVLPIILKCNQITALKLFFLFSCLCKNSNAEVIIRHNYELEYIVIVKYFLVIDAHKARINL